eukprot:3163666-Rhodomonas_salina.1
MCIRDRCSAVSASDRSNSAIRRENGAGVPVEQHLRTELEAAKRVEFHAFADATSGADGLTYFLLQTGAGGDDEEARQHPDAVAEARATHGGEARGRGGSCFPPFDHAPLVSRALTWTCPVQTKCYTVTQIQFRAAQVPATVLCYALATRCAVLTEAMLLPGRRTVYAAAHAAYGAC